MMIFQPSWWSHFFFHSKYILEIFTDKI
jgi:hypothetical protein